MHRNFLGRGELHSLIRLAVNSTAGSLGHFFCVRGFSVFGYVASVAVEIETAPTVSLVLKKILAEKESSVAGYDDCPIN
jgi:hypothetical protein